MNETAFALNSCPDIFYFDDSKIQAKQYSPEHVEEVAVKIFEFFHKAENLLDKNHVDYEYVQKDGKKVIQILPTDATELNRFAKNISENLNGLHYYLNPYEIYLQESADAWYDIGDHSLNVVHFEVELFKPRNILLFHELKHAELTAHEIFGHTGSVFNMMLMNADPQDEVADDYAQKLSIQEMATYAYQMTMLKQYLRSKDPRLVKMTLALIESVVETTIGISNKSLVAATYFQKHLSDKDTKVFQTSEALRLGELKTLIAESANLSLVIPFDKTYDVAISDLSWIRSKVNMLSNFSQKYLVLTKRLAEKLDAANKVPSQINLKALALAIDSVYKFTQSEQSKPDLIPAVQFN